MDAARVPVVRALRLVPLLVVHHAAAQPGAEPDRLLPGAAAAHLVPGALSAAAPRPRGRAALQGAPDVQPADARRCGGDAPAPPLPRGRRGRFPLRRAGPLRALRSVGGAPLPAVDP